MAQGTEAVDFEALFNEAADLDGDEGGESSASTTIQANNDTVMDQATETGEEQAEEAAPQIEQAALPQVDLEEEPAYTQEEIDEFERREILAQQQELERAAREYQARTGKPLVAPEVVQARQKRLESVREVKETTPEIAEAVEQIVDERVAAVTEALSEEVAGVLAEQGQQNHLETVFNAIPGSDELLNDPQRYSQLQDWVDHLPGFMAQRFNAVLDDGSTDEIIGLLTDYSAFPDWREASEQYLSLEGAGGETVVAQGQEQQAEARPQRRQTRNALPEAALAVRSGSTRPLPQGETGGAGVSEFERFYNDPEVIKQADQ